MKVRETMLPKKQNQTPIQKKQGPRWKGDKTNIICCWEEENLVKTGKMVKINPMQSRLSNLRNKSQIYWVMGVGGMVFWEK
jgi:hypothetical protein